MAENKATVDLRWNHEFPQLDNILLWKEIFKVYTSIGIIFFIAPIVFVAIIFPSSVSLFIVPLFIFCVFLVLFLLFISYLIFGYRIITGNQPIADYMVNEEGIGMAIAGFDVTGGIFDPMPTMADERFFARYGYRYYYGPYDQRWSTMNNGRVKYIWIHTFRHIAWTDIKTIRIYQKDMVIFIKGRNISDPIIIYCTESNFNEAVAMIKSKVDPAKIVSYGENPIVIIARTK